MLKIYLICDPQPRGPKVLYNASLHNDLRDIDRKITQKTEFTGSTNDISRRFARRQRTCSCTSVIVIKTSFHCTLKNESFPRILVFSWRFSFFCVIFLSTSLRSLCSNVIQDLRPPRLRGMGACYFSR